MKITPIIVFCIHNSIHFFHLEPLAPTHCAIFIRELSIPYFHLLIKSPFLVIEELLCLEDKQNDGISLLVLNSTSHSFTALTRDELSSKTLEENSLFTRARVLFSI